MKQIEVLDEKKGDFVKLVEMWVREKSKLKICGKTMVRDNRDKWKLGQTKWGVSWNHKTCSSNGSDSPKLVWDWIIEQSEENGNKVSKRVELRIIPNEREREREIHTPWIEIERSS